MSSSANSRSPEQGDCRLLPEQCDEIGRQLPELVERQLRESSGRQLPELRGRRYIGRHRRAFNQQARSMTALLAVGVNRGDLIKGDLF